MLESDNEQNEQESVVDERQNSQNDMNLFEPQFGEGKEQEGDRVANETDRGDQNYVIGFNFVEKLDGIFHSHGRRLHT